MPLAMAMRVVGRAPNSNNTYRPTWLVVCGRILSATTICLNQPQHSQCGD
jgi:hypothetical protein